MDIKPSERMVFRAAQELKENEVVFVGIGLPNLACNFARKSHAPNLFMIYESGAVGTLPERLPVSIGDPALVTDSLSICSSADIFESYLQRGNIDVGFLSGAQIDRYGNINSTIIGSDYNKPKVRLPGSGGACEIAIHSKKVFIVMKMNSRSFVEKCDFITSPGHKINGKTRSELNCPGSGPQAVITDYGVFKFDKNGEMILTEIYDNTSVIEAQKACGFKFKVAEKVERSKSPDQTAIDVFRNDLDPQGLYLK